MTDLEIVQLCARAMGYSDVQRKGDHVMDERGQTVEHIYWPLTDGTQAMALVKRFGLTLDPAEDDPPFTWRANVAPNGDWENQIIVESADLNRAICECVAKLSKETK